MKEFRFVQAENGGWVVFAIGEPGLLAPIKAAFTSTEDLLAGFPSLLQPSAGVADPVIMQQGDV